MKPARGVSGVWAQDEPPVSPEHLKCGQWDPGTEFILFPFNVLNRHSSVGTRGRKQPCCVDMEGWLYRWLGSALSPEG